jgi:hypothetical protein
MRTPPRQKRTITLPTTTMNMIAEVLSDIIALADSWASSGPDTYTKRERKRRNRAEQVLNGLRFRLAKPLK